jgi:Flp pilus assembly protein TadG
MHNRALPTKLLQRDERGAAMIEMALVVPFLLTIGLGVFEFGNIYYKNHLMENAVRDAARFAASRVGDVCTDTALQDEAKEIAKANGQAGDIWTAGTSISVTCTTYNNKANNYKFRGGDAIKSVKVEASVPYESLGFLGFFNLAPPTLKVSHEERVIGVR